MSASDAVTTEAVRHPEVLAELLKADPYLHLYSLGDLDPFFFPHTRWLGSFEQQKLRQLLLLYEGGELPCLLAFSRQLEPMQSLLENGRDFLPEDFYAHLSDGLRPLTGWCWQERGLHLRMGLRQPTTRMMQASSEDIERLAVEDLEEVQAFYRQAYPDNWFDARMLQTGKYFAVRRQRICAVAGVHTYSQQRGVAALGNIATRQDSRGQGLASRLTAHLCRELLTELEVVGLNVAADNAAAIACYEGLGFTEVARYREYAVTRELPDAL